MRDLVSLLYRADWTRLRLAAEVTASRDADLDRTRYDRVEVLVDLALGILLRQEEILDGKTLSVTELTQIRIDLAPAGGEQFLPPGGWDSVHGDAPRTTPHGPGWEASKLIAGLAAGGIGALVRSSRSRSFEQATQEEPEAEMPSDSEPAPADAPAASDEVLHLLHASRDRWAPGIAATLHQWHDIAAMLAQVPDGARRAGFGGLGHLIDAAGERVATLHMVSRLSFDGSGRYRIEPALPAELAARSFRHRAETIICDGERQWHISGDEVTARPAGPPPDEIAKLLDAAWLLEHQLTGGAEILSDGAEILSDGAGTLSGGRRGYRFRVTAGDPGWGRMFFPDEVVVDAELGILLRSVCHAGSRPVSRYELRDVALGEQGDFRADIGEGMRVEEEPDDEPPGPVNIPARVASLLARQAARDARSAVRSVLGGLRR
jgi:X-X-X-Leu-X-X-Gly heptad repeat protein